MLTTYKKIVAVIFYLIATVAEAQRTNITFWHSLTGHNGVVVEKITEDFNHSQSQFRVVPIYKGSYAETLTTLAAAVRAKQQPALVQVFEAATQLMLRPAGVIVPVYELFQQFPGGVDGDDFLPIVRDYYSNTQGELMAFPFNISSAVLYYNRDAFVRAGLDPDRAPRTWSELAKDSVQLKKAGYSCGFTTAWPVWIQVEEFCGLHNVPFASEANGYHSLKARLRIANPVLSKHLEHLAAWQQQGIFHYGGREDNSLSLFTSGTCAMLFETSGIRESLRKTTPFTVAMGSLPYWTDIKTAPQNTFIGGGAIWVLQGQSKTVLQGVAVFLKFLAKPETQKNFQAATGYLPVTKRAYQELLDEGYYTQHPDAKIVMQELLNKPATSYSAGIRLGYYPQIRALISTAIEQVLAKEKSAMQALKAAETEGNRLLNEYERDVQA